ncbi:FAD-binding oxidoreductase [Aspergillus homomorphus CBS 101889]|uniref:FAD-binding domain-containing protein n=1 Tax=Aspergillus homomorphus (strain CBS 101889) TaxID=1450537 RepID=A0A395IAS9_ASPHC|nr:FAD-binding domain-containing protein [Aspergillus homomorphus CBS 101889]RAL17141.1 FAD-binding domain-containing protein [Aspergillus homomorphus CBS 101889]
MTRVNLTPFQVHLELGPRLCGASYIFGPEDPRYPQASLRFQEYLPPKFLLIVRIGCADDISTVIEYAFQNSIPFYTVNRGYAVPISQGKFKGIGLDVQLLTDVIVDRKRNIALISAGATKQGVIDALWAEGYVTTTGAASCTGMVGQALGAGHGRYKTRYGLMIDNIVQLNVVLANGTTIAISEDSHEDLFWAMKGAGQNFGVVTSFEMRIHPHEEDTWYFRNYVFTQDKLEPLFEKLNNLAGNGTQPVGMDVFFGHYEFNPMISVKEVVLFWTFQYAGPQKEAEKYLAPFDALGPINVTDGNVPFPDITIASRNGNLDKTCAKGFPKQWATIGLQVYNATACRQVYDLFSATLKAYPGLSTSVILFEGYSVEAVKAIDPAASAFPHRNDYINVVVQITYHPNPKLDAPALQLAIAVRDLFIDGQPNRLPSAHVSYALGIEPLEQIYGYEPWRLEKLRALKAEYDPYNKFAYHLPVIPLE